MQKQPVHEFNPPIIHRLKPPQFTAAYINGKLLDIEWQDEQPFNTVTYYNKALAFIKSTIKRHQHDNRRSI